MAYIGHGNYRWAQKASFVEWWQVQMLNILKCKNLPFKTSFLMYYKQTKYLARRNDWDFTQSLGGVERNASAGGIVSVDSPKLTLGAGYQVPQSLTLHSMRYAISWATPIALAMLGIGSEVDKSFPFL